MWNNWVKLHRRLPDTSLPSLPADLPSLFLIFTSPKSSPLTRKWCFHKSHSSWCWQWGRGFFSIGTLGKPPLWASVWSKNQEDCVDLKLVIGKVAEHHFQHDNLSPKKNHVPALKDHGPLSTMKTRQAQGLWEMRRWRLPKKEAINQAKI